MARIRTIKPEFFRHEALQDLEAANIGSCCMLVFQGLWTQCDNQGIFPYQPRQLKLDILPFLKFDMKKTLSLLEKAGFIYSYFVNDKQYGIIPSLPEHQRFSGKEAGQEGKRFPPPPNNGEALVKQQGSNREAIVKDQSFTNVQEKEKEKEKEKEHSLAKKIDEAPELQHGERACVFSFSSTSSTKKPKQSNHQKNGYFSLFWQAYPKRVAKGAAEARWKKLNPDEATAIAIIESVNKQKITNEQWQADGGRFIPHPATYLNQQRWLDECHQIPDNIKYQDAACILELDGEDKFAKYCKNNNLDVDEVKKWILLSANDVGG